MKHTEKKKSRRFTLRSWEMPSCVSIISTRIFKLTLAEIGCKVSLCMTDADSVLQKISKVTKYIHGSERLEKEVMEKHFSANSRINSLLDSHNFHKASTHYNSYPKKELLIFGLEVVPPRTVEKFIDRTSK